MYLLDTLPTSITKGVVIGHDHRHNSERFAKLTAAAFITKGFTVYFYRGLVHTPLVVYMIISKLYIYMYIVLFTKNTFVFV
jgi:phosphoglucomutase